VPIRPDLPTLVENARGGDVGAFTDLVKSHSGLVYGIARRMTRDADGAEDVSQETFVKAWLNIRLLRENSSFTSWLSSIAHRASLDFLRKRKPEDPCGEEADEIAARACQEPSGSPVLDSALSQLSQRDRLVLTLFYFGELSSSEVAEVTGIPVENVRVYVHRARRRLRSLLEGRENELLQQV